MTIWAGRLTAGIEGHGTKDERNRAEMNIDTIPNSPRIFKVVVAGVMAFALVQFTKRGKCRT